jgi:hypothetical protein
MQTPLVHLSLTGSEDNFALRLGRIQIDWSIMLVTPSNTMLAESWTTQDDRRDTIPAYQCQPLSWVVFCSLLAPTGLLLASRWLNGGRDRTCLPSVNVTYPTRDRSFPSL